ncbi:MACPF domain-containing protein [Senna tora]|uniref:MACPF domain-containing protein n=1 Tax=Senna tora TaxID=362788 RepID=A0A835CG11_9FABA|nr:MACPF domain-containing protein [Senna tora]
MKRHLNKEMCLESQYVSGHFCASFGLDGHCIKNFGAIRSLSYDGWFIKRYTIELERYPYHGELDNLVKEVVPSLWDPEALAR